MDETVSGQYGMAHGVALAKALATAGLYIFHTDDALRLAPSGVSPTQVPYLLKVLTDAGWLIRLRRGLYAGTGHLPGGVDVPPFVLATALVTPSAIAYWSALSYHDLTDQVPLVVTVVTPRKVVTPSMRVAGEHDKRHTWRVAGVDCRFVTVSEQRYAIGLEWAWFAERFRASITDRERTVLDLFAMPRLFGGVSEGLAVLERALTTLDLEKIIAYALRYRSTTLAKRLGWALEQSGVELSVLVPLQQVPASSYGLLDPGAPRRGRHDRRWKLIINLAAGT